jgi:hypothetical protein
MHYSIITVQAIRTVVDARLKNYAVTYYDTSLVRYDRQQTMATWSAAGLDKFTYRGPHDIKTRPFCATHVGKVHTLAEIEKMDNPGHFIAWDHISLAQRGLGWRQKPVQSG